MLLQNLVFIGLLCVIPAHCTADQHAPAGSMEGHLRIYSPKTVEPQDGSVPTVTAKTYAEYPLVIFIQGNDKKEITRITADQDGNYRVSLPPGAYTLDVLDRKRKHVRAKPRLFTVISNETVRVDLEMDTGIR